MRPHATLTAASLAAAILITGCGGSSGGSAEPASWDTSTEAAEVAPATTSEEAYPSREAVKGWPKLFCTLKIGMARDSARETMGPPVEEYADAEANQDSWTGFNLRLTAYYDASDKVIQLDDSTGDANLPCPETRGGGARSSKGAIPSITLDLDE